MYILDIVIGVLLLMFVATFWFSIPTSNNIGSGDLLGAIILFLVFKGFAWVIQTM